MLRRLSVLAVLFVAAVPMTARAHLFPFGPCGGCLKPWSACGCPRPLCGGCRLPRTGCRCGPPPMLPAPSCALPVPTCGQPVIPQPLFETTVRPVVETTLCPEQFTTCVPVTRTQIRRECHTVNVPVTVHKQVTVDEGCYQMVWVPKPVTKTVAETVLTQQVQQRDVPVQVVEQVPTVQTRMVPRQTVRYIQETRPVGCAQPVGCAHPGFGAPMMAPPAMVPGVPQQHLPTPSSPNMVPPVVPAPANPGEAPPPLSVPDPYTQPGAGEARLETNWMKVPQRTAPGQGDIEMQSYERAVPSVPRGMFSPVPSASAVWRAQSGF